MNSTSPNTPYDELNTVKVLPFIIKIGIDLFIVWPDQSFSFNPKDT